MAQPPPDEDTAEMKLLSQLEIIPPNNTCLNYTDTTGYSVSISDAQCKFVCRYCLWNSLYNLRKSVHDSIRVSYTHSTFHQTHGTTKCQQRLPYLEWCRDPKPLVPPPAAAKRCSDGEEEEDTADELYKKKKKKLPHDKKRRPVHSPSVS
jgi:hypothetical protein